jgi:hypothetical protein
LREVFLHPAKGSNRLAPMPVPERLIIAASGTPSGEALNVGQMYARFAQSIRDSAIRDGRNLAADLRDRGGFASHGRCHQASVGCRSRGDVRLARFVDFFELDFPGYSEGDLKSGSSRNDPNWRTLICGNKFDDRLRLRGQTIVVGGIGATDGTQSSHEPDCEDEGVK